MHPLILRPRALFYKTDCTRRSKFLTHALCCILWNDIAPCISWNLSFQSQLFYVKMTCFAHVKFRGTILFLKLCPIFVGSMLCQCTKCAISLKYISFIDEIKLIVCPRVIKSKGFKKSVDGQCQAPAKVVNIWFSIFPEKENYWLRN